MEDGERGTSPLSLYLHIPFCTSKCRYCDFYSIPYNERAAVLYLAALQKEIELCRKSGLIDERAELQTVFFGGGTPSVLPAGELSALCRIIRDAFPLGSGYEWSVECNPESFTAENSAAMREGGVTRLTFGFQSLNDRELRLLGRVHSAERCRRLFTDATLAPYRSVGVDLMFGLPGQSFEGLCETIEEIARFPRINHLSAYELTIADATPFGRHRRFLPLPAEEDLSHMTEGLWRLVRENGFEQYEVSNFAKKDHRCRHNEAYWDHRPYLGLGCAAHSQLAGERSANVADFARYLSMVNGGLLPRAFVEKIDAKMLAMEMVLLGLRRVKGIDMVVFGEKCGISFANFADQKKIAEFLDHGLLTHEGRFLRPTGRGILVADAMAAAMIP